MPVSSDPEDQGPTVSGVGVMATPTTYPSQLEDWFDFL